jgi:hypothetical protein
MKYLIKESKILPILKKYLDDIEWSVIDYNEWEMTRLFFKDEMRFPEDAIFESYTEEDVDKGIFERVLLVNRSFFTKLKSLFGLTSKELVKFLLEWYTTYTNERVEVLNFID